MSYLGYEVPADSTAKIKVIGIGGAGCNAVNRMIDANLKGVSYVAVNTDKQALSRSKADNKVQIGEKLTKGLGAGGKPEVGKKSAEESLDQIIDFVTGSDLIFITAGMGGGTGTGAAPIIAKAAKSSGALTIGVVTKPFYFEGKKRSDQALAGISELKPYVDSLVLVPNDKLIEVSNENTTLLDAFRKADDILKDGVEGIASLISDAGLINLDFNDVKTVMSNRGVAHMGVGIGRGENRVQEAIQNAINSPLLETDIKGAKGVLLNVEGGLDIGMLEVNEASKLISGQVDVNADIIFGTSIREDLDGAIKVTVVATGFESNKGSYIEDAQPINTVEDVIADELDAFLNNKNSNEYTGQSFKPTLPDIDFTFDGKHGSINLSEDTFKVVNDATPIDISDNNNYEDMFDKMFGPKDKEKTKDDTQFPIPPFMKSFNK